MERHSLLPSVASTIIALLGVGIAIAAFIQSQPSAREFERLWKTIEEHHALPGHAGVLSEVAQEHAQLAGVSTQLEDLARRITELRSMVIDLQTIRATDQQRSARMDENLRNIGLSVPPLSERLASVEANLKALEARVSVLQMMPRNIPSSGQAYHLEHDQ